MVTELSLLKNPDVFSHKVKCTALRLKADSQMFNMEVTFDKEAYLLCHTG